MGLMIYRFSPCAVFLLPDKAKVLPIMSYPRELYFNKRCLDVAIFAKMATLARRLQEFLKQIRSVLPLSWTRYQES